MHEFLVAALFLAMMISPCVIAMSTNLEDPDSK